MHLGKLEKYIIYVLYGIAATYIILVSTPIKHSHAPLLLLVASEKLYMLMFMFFVCFIAFYDYGLAILLAVIFVVTKYDVDVLGGELERKNNEQMSLR